MFKTITPFCILIILISAENIHAQDLTYSIYRGNSEIGHIKISLSKKNQMDKIHILSEASFKVLWNTHHRLTEMEVTYMNKVLQHSKTKTMLNHELDKKTETKKVNGKYECYGYPDENFTINQEIRFSSANLYFTEPVGIDKVYSESYLEMCPLVKEDSDTYKLTLPGDKDNFYTYKNGKLVEVLVDRTWFDITFKREN